MMSRALRIGGYAVVLILLGTVHFLRVEKLVPMTQLATDDPIYASSYGHLYARALRDDALLRETGKSWGYDAFHMAGYPAGNLLERENWSTLVLTRYRPEGVSRARAIKLYIFAAYWLAPFLLGFAALLLFGSIRTALTALALGVSGFCGHDAYSPHLVRLGDVEFVLACYGAALVFGAAVFWLRGPNMKKGLLLLAAVFATTFLNAFVGLFTLATMIVLVVAARPRGLQSWSAPALSVIITGGYLFWWGGRFFALKEFLRPIGVSSHQLKDVLQSYFWFVGQGQETVFVIVRLLLVASSIAALGLLWKKDRWLAVSLGLCLVLTALFAYPGRTFRLFSEFQPRRFLVLFSLIQTLTATYLLVHLFGRDLLTRSLLALLIWHAMTWEITAPDRLTPLGFGLSAPHQTLVSELAALPRRGRILLENDPAAPQFRDALPFLTGQSFLGTAPTYSRLYQAVGTSLHPAIADRQAEGLGRVWHTFDETALYGALRQFAVGYVVARSPEVVHKLREFPAVVRERSRSSDYVFFEVRTKPDIVMGGDATADLEMERITVMSRRSPVLLSLHWHPFMAATPETAVAPYAVFADPVPFVRIPAFPTDGKIVLTTKKPAPPAFRRPPPDVN